MKANSSRSKEAEKRQCFEAFFRVNYNRLQQYVGRRVPHVQVDDVVAATFVVAWKKFDLVEQASLPWLFRIASFEVKSSFRTARRDGHALGSEVLEDIPNTVDEIFDTEPLRVMPWPDSPTWTKRFCDLSIGMNSRAQRSQRFWSSR